MMAVLGPCVGVGVNMNGHNNISNHLTKSLEKILEDAHLSGDLKLSGRKLKEFPKAGQYDLSDTVIADLSKNRLSEVPEELTTYYFLEKLSLSHNVLSSIPDRFGSLQSLTFLDLSNNQLTELPREVCLLPLQILLVNDNQLVSLPKEVGRMSALLDLDASNNRLTQIPMTLGDCNSLKVLDLSNNQLGLLPLQITYLKLEHLDVSCNCISSLPLELRNMTSLVTLELENNPLVSPPITVCIRSIVHIFTYLENLANKDSTPTHKRIEDTRRTGKHSSFLGTTSQGHHITSGNATIDCLRHKPRPVIDSGYITDGIDKRWSNEAGGEAGGGGGGSGRSTPSTPSTLSPGTALSRTQSLSSESPLPTLSPMLSGLRISPPEGSMSNGTDDKSKLAQQQTYRQYKEALRQQRQQDVYRPKTDQSSPDQDSSPQHQTHSNLPKSNGLSPSLYTRTLPNTSPSSPSLLPNSPLLHSTPRRIQNGGQVETHKVDDSHNKRPVQKVVPSRNVNKIYPTNGLEYTNGKSQNGSPNTDSYTKPTSPVKSPTSSIYNGLGAKNMKNSVNGEPKLLTTTVSYLKGATAKPASKMMWSKDIMSEKLSFTMKREFDKQKEETELLQQLRTIIESKLKMQLPDKLSDELCDGVVLCHLANLVRPRSIASIHVPSPAQQKLTMAKCRRNVDNFLDACRRIGVEEEDICTPDDVLRSLDCSEGAWPQNLAPLARTISALLSHATPLKENNQSDSTTTYVKLETQRFIQSEERYVSNFNSNDYNFTIDENEEYLYENNNADFQYSYVDNEIVRNRKPYSQKNKVQFVVPFYTRAGVISSDSLEIQDTDEVDFTETTREEEILRYDRNKLNLNIKNNLNEQLKEIDETVTKPGNENTVYENEHRQLITCLCLGSFVMAVIILFMYPL